MAARTAFMQGNEAILEGALHAGARFFAGYPITPSSEIAELASTRLPARGGVYLQMEDEMASMGAVIGASAAGAPAFTATSGPGFSLMQENLGLAAMAEVPCVVVNVQRSGPSTGLATRPGQADVMQARWGTHGDHPSLVFAPASAQECFDLTVEAFIWAERLRTPVIGRADVVVGHLRELVALPDPEDGRALASRPRPQGPPDDYCTYRPGPDGVPPLADFGSPYIVHLNGSMHDERGYPSADPAQAGRLIQRLVAKVQARVGEMVAVRHFRHDPPEGAPPRPAVLYVAYGSTARAAREAALMLAEKGVPARLLQLKRLWPFPDSEVEAAALEAGLTVVPEMNLGQVVLEVERVVGKRRPVWSCAKSNGEPITPDEILARTLEVVGA
ncbi:MAG: 2-oxoacid:acceptor oxidoreductase subunit alpha [Acetobacteraceae bacterium]|nr:2-oxoacid:acceptor oxidoreductase subunit alpha [Acetobacteraceae bacterium]